MKASTNAPSAARERSLWIALVLVAGVPRIFGAFLLPNAFGDAYAYLGIIGTMSAKLSAGTFSIADLYGFWLPLYQFICACLSVLAGHTFYTAKLVSALSGVGVCLLVYDTSLRLTAHRRASLLAFMLVALSPLHIFNSASAMTDVPHAFFVLAGVAFVLRKRLLLAAVFVALAGLTRMDSWILIALIPALQFLEERRVSLPACIILIFPPLFWFYLSWKATGNWLDNFVARQQYMDWLLSVNPSLANFSLNGIARDAGSLLLSTDLAVLVACFVGIRLAAGRMVRSKEARDSQNLRAVVAVNSFFFAFLSFIVLAYLTHKQPIIFPRYGLLLFVLGLPVLPWTLLTITRSRPQLMRRLFIAAIVACVLNAGAQLAYSVYYINKYERGAVVDYLGPQLRGASAGSHFW